jgi:hypothetical protein
MVGAIVAVWPAPALVISYELLMLIVRRSAAPAPEPAAVHPAALAAGNGPSPHLIQAQQVFADQVADRTVPTIRQIRSGLKVRAANAAEAPRHLAVLA